MTDVRYPDVTVELSGQDGSAFAILGRVSNALKRAGHPDAANEFVTEATNGDYDHLLQTAMGYVNVE